jgi:mannose-1-phosphate guanylyltransferase / mannose-6-phosphate isomerase
MQTEMSETPHEHLCRWHEKYADWLLQAALPLWWEVGADRQHGGFEELIGLDGKPVASPRRARVQGRQSYVYAAAGHFGWNGPWAEGALFGLDYLNRRYKQPDGLFCTEVSAEGEVSNRAEFLYDQAFALMAAAWAARQLPQQRERLTVFARDLIASVETRRHPQGGFRESGGIAFLSNPHMHLLEAALAWFETDGNPAWKKLASEIVDLCLTHFIDAETRSLHEYFDEHWAPVAGDKGHSVEPGHQFEWAWLLERWSRIADDAKAYKTARRLFEVGCRGIDTVRNVAIDEMDDSFAARRTTARLWVQTERLKAALILSEAGDVRERTAYLSEADAAAAGLWQYLETPVTGLWRDKMLPEGGFVAEPAPASSLYHIICAIMCLRETVTKTS